MRTKNLALITFAIFFIFSAQSQVYYGHSDPWFESAQVTPSNPETGETVTASATAGTNERILFMSLKVDDGEWRVKNCDSYVECSRDWTLNLEEGTHEISFRAQNSEIPTQYAHTSRTVTVGSDEPVDENEDPFARLDVEEVSRTEFRFDGTGSSDSDGNIESYFFRFDGGSYMEDGNGVVTESFDEGEHTVRLRVVDNDGADDTVTETFRVEEANTCDLSVGSIEVEADDGIEEDETTSASLRVENNGDDGQDVRVRFYSDGEKTADLNQYIGTGDSHSFRDSHIPGSEDVDGDGEIELKAVVTATDGSCADDFREERTEDITVWEGSSSSNDGDGDTPIGKCELDVGSLKLSPDEIDEGDSSHASVFVENTGEEEQDLFVRFYSREGTYRTYNEQDFGPGDDEKFTARIAEDEDVVVHAEVVADSGNCEEFTYERSNELFVEGDRDRDQDRYSEKVHLTVKVRDEDYDPIYGALVEVDNSDYESDVTSTDGESEFSLDPDSYDITVSKDGYETEYRSVSLEDEPEKVYVTLEEDDYNEPDDDNDAERGVKIRDVDYPSRVCEGSSFTASVRVRNEGDFHEVITLTGSGLGSITTGQSTSVEEGESKTINLRFTNVQGSGNEQFKIVLTNHNDDRVYRTIDVDNTCFGGDYGSTPTAPVTDSPDSITLEVTPQKTTIGNSVLAKGFVNGARGRQTVEITIDGQRKARVTTQPDGYYQVYLTPSKVGSQNVRASAGQVSTNREIEMIPTASVLGVKAPEKQFVGDSFEVCGDVESQVKPRVYLLKDGRVMDFKSGRGEVCFNVRAREEGTHRFEIRALSYGQVSSSFTTTEVLETGSEVENFPDKVAMVESEEGLVKVQLYNQHDELKRYNVNLEGLPSTWSSQSEKEILLTKGEQSNVYFYLTPREVGRYNPRVAVESDNERIFEKEIVMESGGTKTVRDKSFFERMAEFFRL